MQNVSTAMQNRVQALSERFSEEKVKLEELTQKFNESCEANGATSEETQKLAREFETAKARTEALGAQLLDAKDAAKEAKKNLADLKKSAEKAGDGMDDAQKSTKKLANILKVDLKAAAKTGADSLVKMANKADSALKTVAKAGTVAIGAIATGVATIAKQAIEAYADYEQLVGGVETLFGSSADAVLDYANNAYQSAGLSANAYMETVTSFSASLLQSLGGDTEAAVQKANTAIVDMSDNANKMGTDMTSIQNAYQGFAKMNYTMLDNLKLGYGGTKEEMERLIADANALNAAQGILTEYSIDSYADIVDAIHVVQTEMGITGTTAKEAATTIQGSMSAAKAAWTNLMVGIADGNQDFDKLVDNFVGSVETAADNILPRVSTTLDGILKLVNIASEKIIPQAISVVVSQAPALIEAGSNILFALGDALVENADEIFGAVVDTAGKLIPKIAKSFQELVPKIAKTAGSIIKELDGVVEEVSGIYLAFKSLTKGNWIGVGIGLAVTAFGALRKSAADAVYAIGDVSEAEREIIKNAQDAGNALSDMMQASAEAAPAIEKEYGRTKDLVDELDLYVRENGTLVSMAYAERIDVINGALYEATGIELTRNGDLISSYQDLKQSILDSAEAKRASAYLDAYGDDYAQALKDQQTLIAGAAESYEAVQNAKANLAQAEQEWASATTRDEQISSIAKVNGAKNAIKELEAAYNDAATAANEGQALISRYEAAQAAAAEGNYEKAVQLLSDDTAMRWEYLSERGEISQAEINQLEDDTEQKIDYANYYREQYEKGVEGYTKKELDEMDNAIAELQKKYDKAKSDANKAAKEMALEMANGFQSSSNAFIQSVGDMIASAMGVVENYSPIGTTPSNGRPSQSGNFLLRSVRSQIASQASAASPYQITINVNAQTTDLAKTIAREVQNVLDKALSATGITYKAGRTKYA